MKPIDKKKLIASNAAVLVAGILCSFILPMIGDSMTEGRSAFLRMMLHVLPLVVSMFASSAMINKSINSQQ